VVANGGYLMKPQVVKRIESPAGELVLESKPLVVRRVLEPDTVDVLTDVLSSVVREGTGRLAAVPGYSVAGKTGTAQKVDASGRYSMVDHVASFVGFVPVRHPAFVILVSLDGPRVARNQGGDIAAPLFARIAEHALRYRAVPPDDPERVLRVVTGAPVALTPVAYRPPPRAASPPLPPADPGLMPDLRGQSAREAALHAARRGLIVELRGSGRVVEQSPLPGAEIEVGMTGVLTLGGRSGGGP
jgi:cell division protein FtsI (penicillin-binding protein 3)